MSVGFLLRIVLSWLRRIIREHHPIKKPKNCWIHKKIPSNLHAEVITHNFMVHAVKSLRLCDCRGRAERGREIVESGERGKCRKTLGKTSQTSSQHPGVSLSLWSILDGDLCGRKKSKAKVLSRLGRTIIQHEGASLTGYRSGKFTLAGD